ncbi:hypothetical protein Tco_0924574 [Tanacetum coccineum]|uniref:Uncharacterized protein n=1 Tax=Tanacetum coccineum TaxID=301880 RepID=A0ABQ5D4C3_9ASTR
MAMKSLTQWIPPMWEKSKLMKDKRRETCLYQDTRAVVQLPLTTLGDRLVSWSSKRQKSAAISSTEAEYIALSGCCAQVLWMRSQLTMCDYGLDSQNSNVQ